MLAGYFLKDFKNLQFITVTTYHHVNGYGDRYCRQIISNWFKKLKITNYVLVCERQRDTGDLHFHIIAETPNYNVWKEAVYLANKFESDNPAAILDRRYIPYNSIVALTTRLNYVVGYITKKSDYSSLFFTNTYSISKTLMAKYRQNAHKVLRKVDNPSQFADLLVKTKSSTFVETYEFSEFIWESSKLNTNNGTD